MNFKFYMYCFWGLLLIASCKQTTNEIKFKVRGNCEMCKERIENTALKLEGVKDARWNVETGIIQVLFDSSKVKLLQIHSSIANEGHGTNLVEMNLEAHSHLPDCCKIIDSKQ